MAGTLLNIIIPAVTFIASFLTFFIAFRSELKKNTTKIVKAGIDEERRHSTHERRLAVVEERLAQAEGAIGSRLDEINKRLELIYGLFIQHLKEKH